jgi:AraC-like DNA-binding protein
MSTASSPSSAANLSSGPRDPAHQHQVRPGLTLRWGAAAPTANFPFRPDEERATTLLVFVLTGDPSRRHDRMLLLRPAALGACESPGSSVVFHVTIALSAVALQELIADDKTPGHARIRAFATTADAPALALPLTPVARMAVDSIRCCPFGGAFRAMALTARCSDLLVEFLTALSSAATPRPLTLTRTVDDQIRAAAEFIAQQLEEPPTLAVLARQVGVSETTLKRGFRQIFGTTVFGYLRARRMEHARALLQSGEATVLEAAALVGYSNPSNFASAFRRQFGLNPKAFQLTARRQ